MFRKKPTLAEALIAAVKAENKLAAVRTREAHEAEARRLQDLALFTRNPDRRARYQAAARQACRGAAAWRAL